MLSGLLSVEIPMVPGHNGWLECLHAPLYPVCMRRLLPQFLAVSLLLALSAPALAGNSRATNRLPSAVTKINLAITSPLTTVSGRHKPVHLTLTRAAAVAQVVAATNALPVARVRVMCPMIMLGAEQIVLKGKLFGQPVNRVIADGGCDVGIFNSLKQTFR